MQMVCESKRRQRSLWFDANQMANEWSSAETAAYRRSPSHGMDSIRLHAFGYRCRVAPLVLLDAALPGAPRYTIRKL